MINGHGSHTWSGWPGCICLACGCGDPGEALLICPGYDVMSRLWFEPAEEAAWREANAVGLAPCAEPSSKRHDPYARLKETPGK